ncbi:MAG: helix-turn-helix domain-containing protein [Aristaeellaceae bacterium]
MPFNFDMRRIGQTIARLRREHNMTQMHLADEMGVSFQAVSNWERGQSMPDIAKLPELAELFGTTIDALLGHSFPLVEHAAEGRLEEYAKTENISVEALTQAAPILAPQQLDLLTDQLLSLPKLPDITELLPFLSTERVDRLMRQCLKQGQDIHPYIFFASTRAVDEIALALDERGESICDLAPAMSTEQLDSIALRREQAGQDISSLLPFLSGKALQAIVLARLKRGSSIHQLLPFMDTALLEKLASAAVSAE